MVEVARLIQLLESGNLTSWGKLLFSLAQEQGFEKVTFAILGSRHAKLEAAFVHSNFSHEWRQRYDSEKLAYTDPTVRHCLRSTLPVMWTPAIFDAPKERELYEEACGYGLRAGVTFPIHGPSGEVGLVSFASDTLPNGRFASDLEQVMPALALIRDYAFASSLQFVRPPVGADGAPHLTPRELEVLKWVTAGKSSWEISKITNCSEATINFHMANIRQKFNVNTRQQAVVKAISLGLLIPEDHHR
jgi:LuxR family quorum-sensing transcriptional regulator LasR